MFYPMLVDIYLCFDIFQLKKKIQRPGKVVAGKGKKKRTTLRYIVDCTHPVEDGIMDVANFVSLVFLLKTL